MISDKECREYHVVKTVDAFYAVPKCRDGYSRFCRECQSAKDKIRHAQQREKRAAQTALSRLPDETTKRYSVSEKDRVCIHCDEKKPAYEFSSRYYDEVKTRNTTCRACVSLISKQKYREKKQQKQTEKTLSVSWQERIKEIKDKQHDRSLNRFYGINSDRYNSMLEAQ